MPQVQDNLDYTSKKLDYRWTSDEPVREYRYDDEHTYMYKPLHMNNNKFFGSYSRLYTQNLALDHELHNDLMPFQAHYKAKVEIMAYPACFDRCVQSVSTGTLSSDEKNCMRECVLKRYSCRDDLGMLAQHMMARQNVRERKNKYV